jgi:nucleoside-diphosphate-sugar epimerase
VRVVVTGATGNVGTSVLGALATAPEVESIVGLARRVPSVAFPKVTWRQGDVTHDDLTGLLDGADALIHLAWIVQPNHDEHALQAVNVGGTARVLEAAAKAGVGVVVCASSFGAYSPRHDDVPVDESWPTHGIPGSWYSGQKAYAERLIDGFELAHPDVRVVRFRSALILKREAAAEAHRLYGGPLLPRALARAGVLPAVADVPGLRVQAVHSADVGDAYRRALVRDVRGPFNLAADPVLDSAALADVLGARRIGRIPPRLVRAGVAASWRMRLQPTSPDWVDLLGEPPVLDSGRAQRELGWAPAHTGLAALREFVEGIADGAGGVTPPLLPLAEVRPSFRP